MKHGGRATIDKMLANPKYVHYIVDADVYRAVQSEKARRSNMETSSYTLKRRTTHYSSKALLSI